MQNHQSASFIISLPLMSEYRNVAASVETAIYFCLRKLTKQCKDPTPNFLATMKLLRLSVQLVVQSNKSEMVQRGMKQYAELVETHSVSPLCPSQVLSIRIRVSPWQPMDTFIGQRSSWLE